MGTDICRIIEVKEQGKWKLSPATELDMFHVRNYSLFGFLADVRNYSHCTPISEARGLPDDSEYLNEKVVPTGWGNPESRRTDLLENTNNHFYSWLTLKELLDFDYNQTFENRRTTKRIGNRCDGAFVVEEGQGEIMTYKEHLESSGLFENLVILSTFGAPENIRIIFWFD